MKSFLKKFKLITVQTVVILLCIGMTMTSCNSGKKAESNEHEHPADSKEHPSDSTKSEHPTDAEHPTDKEHPAK